jgi:AbiU2
MMQDEIDFKNELEVYRKEEEVAQQYFFSWLGFRDHAGRSEKVLNLINETPLLWITTHHALLVASFVALGRVFDQHSKHNVDSLLRMAGQRLHIFSKAALAARKEKDGITPQDAQKFAACAYEPSAVDFRSLRREVAKQRRIYESRYRDVRDKVFAHKELADLADINALLAKTNIEEMKFLFSFLYALHDALWELMFNGRKPGIVTRTFELPPNATTPGRRQLPGEIVAHDAVRFFEKIISSDRAQR